MNDINYHNKTKVLTNNIKTMMQKKFNRTTAAAEELRFDDMDIDDGSTKASSFHSRRTAISDFTDVEFERAVPDDVADTAKAFNTIR